MNFRALQSRLVGISGSAQVSPGVNSGVVYRPGSAPVLRWLGVLMLAGFGLPPLQAQETPPLLEAGKVQVTASAERSTLNRVTGVLTSAVDIEATNVSGQRIDGPVHAIIAFKTPEDVEVREAVTVPGALGGFDKDPWQQPFFDLTGQLGANGWQPGTVLRLPLSFSRARTLRVLYEVTFAGRINHEPVVNPGGPYTGRVGSEIIFTGAATDPDGDPLTFAWDFGSGPGAPTPEASRAFATAGVPRVTLTVNDGRGGVVVRDVTVLVAPPGNFALAHTRVVDGTGHPLGGVQVNETSLLGSREFPAGDEGFVSLGLTAGDYGWTFSAPGHRPVHRQATLLDGGIRLLPSPWLAREGGPVEVSVLESTTLTAGNNAVRLIFPAGAFTQPGAARLSPLGPQTLPFPLPFGWSPLAAFHLDLPETPTLPAASRLKLAETVAADETLTMVRFDETARVWRVIKTGQADPARRDEFNISFGESGSVAVLVRDNGPGAPLPGTIGDPLSAGTPQNLESLVTAVGSVTPQEKPASLDPDAVTAVGEAVFTPATGVPPSGSWFRLGVQETYDLTDGTGLRTPDYDATVYAYRRPGPGGTTVRAAFPLRPRLLFGPAELKEAHLHVDVLPPLGDGPAALSEAGGSLGSGGFKVVIPRNALGGVAVGSLRSLGVAGFAGLAGSGFVVTGAFELNLASLAPGTVLDFSITTPVAPGADFMLAKLVSFSGGSGLAPVQRLRSNVAGVLTNVGLDSPPRLPGLNGPGQYLLVQLPAAQGLVSGLVRTSGGVPAAGIGTRLTGQSWLSVTGADGSYFLTAPAGDGTVLASNSANGDGAAASFTMPPALAAQEVDLTLGALAPRVLLVTPPDKALKVAVVTPLTVEFSEKISPASLGATPLTLRAAGTAADVPASFTLDLANRIVTLLPVNPLDPATDYTLTVSGAIRDLQNLALAGPREFTFTTAAPAARGTGAELVIYEPGGTGPTPADQAIIEAIPGYIPGTDRTKVVATGGPGTADPGVPVILVNDSTGETATVLSKPDGSFANFVQGGPDDFISAVFVNANGTRIRIPASRQKFDDGRVGLFRQGGILEAENAEPGKVQVIVEPDSVAARTIFRVERLSVTEVLRETGNVEPEGARVLGGIKFEESGELSRVYSNLRFPVRIEDLGLPAGLSVSDAVFALTVPRRVEGTIIYEIVDGLTFVDEGNGNGQLITASPPFVGLLLREIAALRESTGLSDTLAKVSRTIAEGALSTLVPSGVFAIPVIFATGSQTTFRGACFTQKAPALVPFTAPDGTTTLVPEGPPGEPVPLAGALIRVALLGAEFIANVLRSGEFVAVSDQEGKCVLRLPQLISSQVVATHRRFPFQTVRSGIANIGIISGASAKFIFSIPPPAELEIPDTSPPAVAVRQLSSVASVGSGPTDGLVLDVTAIDDLKVESVTVQLEDFSTLIGNTSLIRDLSGEEIGALQPVLTLPDDDGSPARSHQQLRVKSGRSGRATYLVTATDGVNPLVFFDYTVIFSTAGVSVEAPPGRRVSFIWPPGNAAVAAAEDGEATPATVARGTPIKVRFSAPLTPALVDQLHGEAAGTLVQLGPDGVKLLHVEVAPDLREMTIYYWVAKAEVNTLTLSLDLRLAEQEPIQQVAGQDGNARPFSNYALTFARPATLQIEDGEQPTGPFGGVAQLGTHLYSIERGPGSGISGRIFHYEVMSDARVEGRPVTGLPESFGRPMDLVVVPGYALRKLDGAFTDEANYLVLYAGDAGGAFVDTAFLAATKRAHVWQIGVDGVLVPFRIGSDAPVLTSAVAQVTRARWDPPFLSFLEIGSDNTSVVLTTFNGLINAADARKQNAFAQLLQTGQTGADLNNDGDFADLGEKAPLPPRIAGQAGGVEFSWAPSDAGERVSDYDLSADFGLLGAVFRGPAGNGFAMVLGGAQGVLDDTTARVIFPEDPKRMKLLPQQRLLDPSRPGAAGESNSDIVRDVVLVSCVNPNPAQSSVLLVIDITKPDVPVLLGRAVLPVGLGSLNSIVPRGDGLLAVSVTGGGIFLLDPRLLLVKNADGTTAALRQQLPGLDSNVSSFVSTAAGVNAGNAGSKVIVSLTQPTINVVRFDGETPEAAATIARRIVDNPGCASRLWDDRLVKARNIELNAEATLFDAARPADPKTHHYVIVQAPGAAAAGDGTLALSAAAIAETGLPLLPAPSNRAPTFIGEEKITRALLLYGAMKAAHLLADIDFDQPEAGIIDDLASRIADLTAQELIDRLRKNAPNYPSSLTGHRLSKDPASPLYNTFIAGPIVLLHKDAPVDFVVADTGNAAVKRAYLRAAPYYWVGLAPRLKDQALVGPFASTQIDDLDGSFDPQLDRFFTDAKGIITNFASGNEVGGVIKLVQAVVRRVNVDMERSMHPGHVALVNFGFRRNPLILIPGVMGSRLADSTAEPGQDARWVTAVGGLLAHAAAFLDAFPLPATFKQAIQDALRSRVQALAFKPDNQPLNGGLDTRGVLRRITLGEIVQDFNNLGFLGGFLPSGVGGTLLKAVLEEVDEPIYQPLILHLQAYLAYEEYLTNGRSADYTLGGANWDSLKTGPDLYVFPYDWRQDNRLSAEKLAELVEMIQVAHPDSPRVDILAHSMGGLVGRRFVLDYPDKVDRFISIVSPYLGATKAVYATRTGDFDEMAINVFIPPDRMRIITRHMPGVHQLMPNRGLFELGFRPLVERGWDLDGHGDATGALDYGEYKTALDTTFFRFPDEDLAGLNDEDKSLLSAQPQPISKSNEPFIDDPGQGNAGGNQYNWRADLPGRVRYTHFVALQSTEGTIAQLEARPVLVPEKPEKNLSLVLPPVDFFDSEERLGVDQPILPDLSRSFDLDTTKAYRLTWKTDFVYGGGDATVPFLSQTRGFGATVDFNAPGAQVIPILNPDGIEESDVTVSHNGVLLNPQLFAWVDKALQDEIIQAAQPSATISASPAAEGQTGTFEVSISNPPAPAVIAADKRRVYWDMGDGTVLEGPFVRHAYERDGDYTVSCAVSWEPGEDPPSGQSTGVATNADPVGKIAKRPTFATLTSARITVPDAAATFAVTGPAGAVSPQSLATFKLGVTGPGRADAGSFRWDFGDGSILEDEDTRFVVDHVYEKTGTFTVKVEVKDDEGTLTRAETQIIIALNGTLGGAGGSGPAAPPDAPVSLAETETVELRLTGHTASPDDVEVRHDGTLVYDGGALIGGDRSVVRRLATEPSDSGGRRVETLIIPRRGIRGDTSIVETTVEVAGEAPALNATLRYQKPGQPPRCFSFRINYSPPLLVNSPMTFRLPWEELSAITQEDVAADRILDLPGQYLFAGATIERCDDRAPALNFSKNEPSGELALRADDDTVPDAPPADGNPHIQDTEVVISLGGPPLSLDPSAGNPPADRGSDLDGLRVYPTTSGTATMDSPAGAVAAQDSQLNTGLQPAPECPPVQKPLTQSDINKIQDKIKEAFRLGSENDLFKDFVLDMADLWLFEQGSGALLWKTNAPGTSAVQQAAALLKIQGIYVKGKSDNDYEIFMPVFKTTPDSVASLDPTNPTAFQRFPELAHQPFYMQGDWYFLPPKGEAADGTPLGDLPDAEDAEAFRRYVDATARWVYKLPGGVGNLAGSTPGATFKIAKGATLLGEPAAESPFRFPATPAEVVSHIFTRTVKDRPGTLRKTLPDVSFFPFRREHFSFAFLSLEKPPPFGDDPIGDAGMGRQLLLLKWVLEGAFLPPFSGFNAALPGGSDLQTRLQIWNRLGDRESSMRADGLEWGLYQEWALLRENARLRVRPAGVTLQNAAALAARERSRNVFGNYLDAHDDKVLKKVGKAGIRAALAAVIADPTHDDLVFGTSPSGFDANSGLRSFEHYIRDVAADAGQDRQMLDLLLGAKLGSAATLCQIRQRAGGVDGFVQSTFSLLRQTQTATVPAYEAFQQFLVQEARFTEFQARQQNAQTLEAGFLSSTGNTFPGRRAMNGQLGTHTNSYSFVVNLQKNFKEAVGPISVSLERAPGDEVTCLVPSFPANDLTFTLKHEISSGVPALAIFRQASDLASSPHRIGLFLPPGIDFDPRDNVARLESQNLDLGPLFNPSNLVGEGDTRWVFRGMHLPSAAAWGEVVQDQLANGEFWSTSRLDGFPDNVRRAQLVAEVQQRIAQGGGFDDHTNADLRAMSELEQLAVQHVSGVPNVPMVDGEKPSGLGISTAERVSGAIQFGFSNATDPFVVLLAFEVPRDQGIEYVRSSRQVNGQPFLRVANRSEGNEVVFFGTVPFRRVLAWQISQVPGFRDAVNVVQTLGEFQGNN